jgi:hypothetical protein
MSCSVDGGGGWHCEVDFESCDVLLEGAEEAKTMHDYTEKDFAVSTHGHSTDDRHHRHTTDTPQTIGTTDDRHRQRR